MLPDSLMGFSMRRVGLRGCAAVAVGTLLCGAVLSGFGCAYGPPAAVAIERPTIAPGATPVYRWHMPRATVYYFWNKLAHYDVQVTAKAWFPADWKDDGDARWEVAFATIATPDLDPVPGAFLGIQRTYTDHSGAKLVEVVPPVAMETLHDGLYGVIENGVEIDPANPGKIKAIRPVLHLRAVKNSMLDLYWDLPIALIPDVPSELTPLPANAAPENASHGTTLGAVPTKGAEGGAGAGAQVDPLTGEVGGE